MVALSTLITLVSTFGLGLSAYVPAPPPPACPCYTATSYISDSKCPVFKPTRPCIRPLCLLLSTTTIPATNTRCSTTPTTTSLLPCETACPVGCATATFTETYSSSCLPTATMPPVIPTHTRPCYTRTITASNKCPEDSLGCASPDCIWLSTTTVPAGPVGGCPVTPTETKTRSCKGTCDAACGTQWTTATATAW